MSAAGFVPAAMLGSYGAFLIALHLRASSITPLQVAANPYVAVIGAPETAASRLNLVQALNSAGTTVAPLFGGMLILARSASGVSDGVDAVLTTQQRAAEISSRCRTSAR